MLKPNESYNVEVVCNADDASKFSDSLFFIIKEGVDKEVALRAKAVGSTIFCKNIENITFGTLYTFKPVVQEIFLENKGRKMQAVKWVQKIEKEKEGERAKEQTQALEEPAQQSFQIYPESVVLPPKSGLMFQIKAFSKVSGRIQEFYILQSQVGTDRKLQNLFTTSIEGNYITPSLSFSVREISFKYSWSPENSQNVLL